MSWFDFLNGNYLLEIPNSKESIINILQEKIGEAKKDKSWFSFKNINYKKFVLEGDSVIVNRKANIFNPYRGLGTIKIQLINKNAYTLIDIKIIPYGEMRDIIIGICLFFLSLFSLFAWLVIPGSAKYLFIAIAWIIACSAQFFAMSYYRYRLKKYAEKILDDLNIQGELKSVTDYRSN